MRHDDTPHLYQMSSLRNQVEYWSKVFTSQKIVPARGN